MPDPLPLPIDRFESVLQSIVSTGAAPLVWYRLRKNNAQETGKLGRLADAARMQRLRSRMIERETAGTFRCLRAAGIEPILAKGWAVARLYPEPGLRPFGDIDIWVRPSEYEAARNILYANAPELPVDLHRDFRDLSGRTFEAVFADSAEVLLEDVPIRVFSHEDHIRLLSLHMLHHGLWRPLWLCDLALMIEKVSVSVAWRSLIGTDVKGEWISACILLASEILGARLGEAPEIVRAKRLPAWLVPAVIEEWGRPIHYMQTELDIRHPRGTAEAILLRWPNPIQATFNLNRRPAGGPRFAFQAGECIRRTLLFLKRRLRNMF